MSNALRPPAEPVTPSLRRDGDRPRPLIERASDLDDTRLEDLMRGFIERWRSEMKLWIAGVAIGGSLSFAALGLEIAGKLPAGASYAVTALVVLLTPLILWRQHRLQTDEAARTGVAPSLVKRLWWRQFRIGARPRVMLDVAKGIPGALTNAERQLQLNARYWRMARDELAALEGAPAALPATTGAERVELARASASETGARPPR